jgi:hypothetical protein
VKELHGPDPRAGSEAETAETLSERSRRSKLLCRPGVDAAHAGPARDDGVHVKPGHFSSHGSLRAAQVHAVQFSRIVVRQWRPFDLSSTSAASARRPPDGPISGLLRGRLRVDVEEVVCHTSDAAAGKVSRVRLVNLSGRARCVKAPSGVAPAPTA